MNIPTNGLLSELLSIDQERVRREKVVLHTVWDRLVNRVKLSMRSRSSACIFEIPGFIPGYPLTNIPKTMDYLLKKLRNEGLLGIQVSPSCIYIAWDPMALRELEHRIRTQNTPKDTSQPTQAVAQQVENRDKDFIDLLVREKMKDAA